MAVALLTTLHAPRPLGKAFRIGAEGAVASVTVPGLWEAEAQRGAVASLPELGELLDGQTAHDAVLFGVPEHERCMVLAEKGLPNYTGALPAIKRGRESLHWPAGPGVMLLDYDVLPGAQALAPDDLVRTLREAVPELRSVSLLHRASSSSWIYRADGEEVHGLRGQHLYLIVEDASRIPEVGRLIGDRLWLAGQGRIDVDNAGQRRERTLIDGAVWQPERLDFACAAVGPGLELRRPPSHMFGAEDDDGLGEAWLAPDALAPLTPEEVRRVEGIKAEARQAEEPAARAAREAWADSRTAKLPAERRQAARAKLLESVESQTLPLDFELIADDGEVVPVSEIMANRVHWHGRRFADPLDPTYRDDARIAVARLVDVPNPVLYSHAHGGVRYFLERPCVFEDLTKEPPDAEAVGRFRALTVREMMGRPAPSWWVRGVLPQAQLGMVFGASGSGKSFAVLDIGAAIARGVPWAGREVKQSPVAYIAAEGAWGFGRRLQGYVQRTGVDPAGFPFYVIPTAPNLFQGEDWKAIAHALPAGVKLVFVDTLAQVSPGADENLARDMGRVLANCQALAQASGAMVVLVHHSGKDATAGARGWSGLFGAMDVVLEVSQQGDRRALRVAKLKDGRGQGDVFPFELRPVTDWGAADGEDETDRPAVAEFSGVAGAGEFERSPRRERRPGAAELALRKALDEVLGLGATARGPFEATEEQVAAAITRAAAALPAPTGSERDRRRDKVRIARWGLQDSRALLIIGAGGG